MAGLAAMDMLTLDAGICFLGSPSAVYDQPAHDRIESLAWALARREEPSLSASGASYRDLVGLWNEAHADPKAKQDTAARDALMAHMLGA